MANALYPKWKQDLLQGTANTALTGTLKAALVDTGTYTFSTAHTFMSSVTGTVGTAQTINTKTFTDGVVDGADVTFPAVTGATVEAIVIFVDTGSAATSRPVAYYDTGVTGLPVTPNGGDISVVWDASGIFAL